MRIALFGATGGTGRHVTEQALDAGHEVTALVRSIAKLSLHSDRLHLIVGDALNADDVARTVFGQDAVISLIGPTKGGAKDIAATSTAHMLSAMKAHGVRRIVVASVGGIPTPEDSRGVGARIAGSLVKLLLGAIYEDRARQLALLQQSDVDWVAVRLPRLTDRPATHAYEYGYEIKPTYSIPRADVAAAMLAQLEDDTHVGHAPIVHA